MTRREFIAQSGVGVVAVTVITVEPRLIPPAGRGALMGCAREQGLRSLNANRNPALCSSAVVISGKKTRGGSPDLKFREVSKLSPFGCVGLTGSEDRESGH